MKFPPMLLLPFIENSFKHGKFINGVLNIDISLKLNKDELYFTIKNNRNLEEGNTSGIGLKNIKKRLELLYPNQHELQIVKDEKTFEICLILNPKSIYEKA